LMNFLSRNHNFWWSITIERTAHRDSYFPALH
jgi:hypothetical protein